MNEKKLKTVTLRASTEINVAPEEVFALVSDLRLKTPLCPHTAVIRITKQPEGPVAVGTTFQQRVTIDGHIADYQNRVIEFIPSKRMVTESDTSPSFRIVVTVEPNGNGCRLTQVESFPLSELIMPIPKANGWIGKLLRGMFGKGEFISQGDESLVNEATEMRNKLEPRLEAWLASIKQHLEAQRHQLPA